MISSDKEKSIFRNLLVKSIDGEITPEEVGQFNALLSAYSDLEDYYIRCVRLQFALREIRIFNDFNIGNSPDYKDQTLWEALADAERGAPAIEIPAVEEPKIIIQKVRHQKVIRKISKGSLFTLLTAVAAIVLILVLVRFLPPETGIKVAVLADSMNAKWTDIDGRMEKGAPILTSRKSLVLQEGCVQLHYDNNAQITIEGPAEFQVCTEDQIKLRYGRLYAIIPWEAVGFSVYTVSTKIVDLGTEFGVQADVNGSAELHVMKGKTQLFAGPNRNFKLSQMLNENEAVKYDINTGETETVPIRNEAFVRSIDSASGMMWRGQKTIDLADIVGGGNGFSAGLAGSYIDPSTGQWFSDCGITTRYTKRAAVADSGFHPVPSNRFIDGVFVPNSKNGPVVISSLNHQFKQAPATSGRYWVGVVYPANTILGRPLVLDGIAYGTSERHALFMHCNVGITFDLMSLRELLPEQSINEFTAMYGIPDRSANPTADFWVLVDGQVRFSQKDVKSGQSGKISIPLSGSDRFLTLVTTEGQTEFISAGAAPTYQTACIFGTPILKLE